MDRMAKNTGIRAKIKKKMTKEQIQLAIVKKKKCDSKALVIVERLLEPEVDPEWLIENLVHINKCHMEDVIEERAITKLCGYVLCQKPLTVTIHQRYHISLKTKKVYDVTKRKNFCSSSCFGASNYLLEQMLTSPLWLRDEEEIPKFQIFKKNNAISNISHGEELNITDNEYYLKDKIQIAKSSTFTKEFFNNNTDQTIKTQSKISNEKKMLVKFQDFAMETIKNINIDKINLNKNDEIPSFMDNIEINNEIKDTNFIKETTNEHNEIDIIKQHKDFEKEVRNRSGYETFKIQNLNSSNNDNSENTDKLTTVKNCNKILQSDNKICSEELKNDKLHKHLKIEKSKLSKKKKQGEKKVSIDINIVAKIEKSFQEWITDATIHFLFGDDFIKQKQIENIETQENYSVLCKKLNKLQFQDQHEKCEIKKPILKPVPYFTVLQEEGQKLDLKVNAFYQGKTTIEKDQSYIVNEKDSNLETFLPLTDIQAPHILRRKIFLEKLDQILPELLRTLAGNNEVYVRASCNYTSVRYTAVKALVHTFSLSPKNIIFKTVEWTLVGLVIIKMLSLLDPWLTTLLSSQQANMYISMILTSYKLDPHYLNLLVNSFNPNMNPK